MNTVEEVKENARKQIEKLRLDLKVWESILTTITSNETSNLLNSVAIQTHNTGQINNSINTSLESIQIKAGDYSASLPFEDKALFFARKHNRAFSNKELTNFILEQEGPEIGAATIKNISQKLTAICKGRFVAAKFDDVNKYKFYLLHEWRFEDCSDIRNEYYPTAMAFGSLPLDRRNYQHLKFSDKQ